MAGNRRPISAKVSAPHNAITPPAIHTKKKMELLPVVAATEAGFLKMPIPMTRLTTIMERSKRLSWLDFAVIV